MPRNRISQTEIIWKVGLVLTLLSVLVGGTGTSLLAEDNPGLKSQGNPPQSVIPVGTPSQGIETSSSPGGDATAEFLAGVPSPSATEVVSPSEEPRIEILVELTFASSYTLQIASVTGEGSRRLYILIESPHNERTGRLSYSLLNMEITSYSMEPKNRISMVDAEGGTWRLDCGAGTAQVSRIRESPYTHEVLSPVREVTNYALRGTLRGNENLVQVSQFTLSPLQRGGLLQRIVWDWDKEGNVQGFVMERYLPDGTRVVATSTPTRDTVNVIGRRYRKNFFFSRSYEGQGVLQMDRDDFGTGIIRSIGGPVTERDGRTYRMNFQMIRWVSPGVVIVRCDDTRGECKEVYRTS